ncbi:MAG: purine-nucleoside phosphorylase [Bacteroidia bacterium]|nr:purine-nucleoside phosphorylase [Bacteroidia bacterium]
MGTPHINAEPGAFAKVVLMPGDPLRAKWIAETYLVDAKLVNEVRGILAYTGKTKNGRRLSVMASGMGQPSIGIYSHELYTGFGVESIIRIGTCGSYQEKINLFDVLACQTASTDSNWAAQYDLKGGTFSAPADFDLLVKAYEILKKRNMPLHVGNILSADVFYDVDRDSWKKWAALGLLGVEMESYSLYATAARLGKRALCLLTVTDHFVKSGKATSEQRQLGLGKMVEVAIEVAEAFA